MTAPIEPDAYELAHAIAQHLAGWAAEEVASHWDDGRRSPGQALLVRKKDGGKIGLNVGGWRNQGRVAFHTRWPQYRDGRSFYPRDNYSITCSATRAPAAIAADLERRLLAWYDQVLPRAHEEIRTSNASAKEAACAARRLAHAARASAPSSEHRGNGDYIEFHGRLPGVDRVRISPAYDANPLRVRLELDDLSAEAALELLARVRALKVDVPRWWRRRRPRKSKKSR